MSTTKTKEELVRMAWVTELRRQGNRKCEGTYSDHFNRVCALGLLREIEGNLKEGDPDTIASAAGLTALQCDEVVWMNDGAHRYRKHTFSEIADVVESWFSK